MRAGKTHKLPPGILVDQQKFVGTVRMSNIRFNVKSYREMIMDAEKNDAPVRTAKPDDSR